MISHCEIMFFFSGTAEQSMSFFDQVNETAPREHLRRLQFDKLQRLLREISGRNRFYTKKWKDAGVIPDNIHTLSDFQKLPLTCKSELVRAAGRRARRLEPMRLSVRRLTPRVHQTSGTTGAPMRVVDTPESWNWWGYCWGQRLKGARG